MDSWVTLPTLRSFGASMAGETEQKVKLWEAGPLPVPSPALLAGSHAQQGGPMVPVVMDPKTGSELTVPCTATSDTRYSVDGCKPVRLACLRVPSSVSCCPSSSSWGL